IRATASRRSARFVRSRVARASICRPNTHSRRRTCGGRSTSSGSAWTSRSHRSWARGSISTRWKGGRKSLLVVTGPLGDIIDIYRVANQSNVAIYPIDPQGLGMGSVGAQDWLRVLAQETGGRAIVNTNGLRRGLSNILDDAGGYFLIGYVSPHANDGKF